MTSDIPSQSPPSVLTWLSTIQTPSTSASRDSPIIQTSPSLRRKRQRSVEISTPAQVKRRTTHSLDLKEGTSEKGGLKGFEDEKARTLASRGPLQEGRERIAAFIKMASLNARLTPKPSNKSSDSHSAYSTPSGSSSASIPIPGLKLHKSAHNVRQTLAQHGMQIDVERLRENYKWFLDTTRTVLGGERGSTMKQGSAEHIIRWIRQNKTRSEDTIMAQLVPLIIPSSRKVPRGTAQNDTTQIDAAPEDKSHAYEVKFFSDDGALVNINRQFNRDVLPTWLKAEDQSQLRKMLAKEPGMTAPKPDYTYGIREEQHPDIHSQRFSNHTRALMGVAPEMVHPYFIIEGKTTKGDLADAENQAIRAGATIVHARRLLNAKAGVGDVVGPDRNSFVYSMTMDTNIARIWINWCEILPKRQEVDGNAVEQLKDGGELYETYHMNALYTALLDDEEMLKELRRRLNNIIDWGCIQRMNEIKAVMTEIYKIEQAAEQKEASIGMEDGSPKKKLKRLNT